MYQTFFELGIRCDASKCCKRVSLKLRKFCILTTSFTKMTMLLAAKNQTALTFKVFNC